MLEIIRDRDEAAAGLFTSLKATRPDATHVLLRLTPDADGWRWLETLHHDVDGALRGLRYLADKATEAYDPIDPKGRRAIASIAKHLETLHALKRDVIDQALPLDGVGKP